MSQTTIQNSEQTTQQSTRAAWDYAVRAQQINVRFAQRFIEAWIDAMRRQAELSQEMMQEFSGKGEDHSDGFQRVFGQWGFPVTGLPFDSFAFWREWMRFADRTTQAVSSNNKKY